MDVLVGLGFGQYDSNHNYLVVDYIVRMCVESAKSKRCMFKSPRNGSQCASIVNHDCNPSVNHQ